MNRLLPDNIRRSGSVRTGKQAICLKMKEMAFAKGPDTKLPTRDQLSSTFGVSSATIDNVLDQLEDQEVIYRVRGSGIYVSPKILCKNIRVLINASLVGQPHASPFWGVLWAKIVEEGQRRAAYKHEDIQVQLLIPDATNMKPLPSDVMRGIESGLIHGVLGIGLTDLKNDFKIPRDIPLVSFAGTGHWIVTIADEDTIAQGVRSLAESGCRKIGYWRRMNLVGLESDQTYEVRDAKLFIQALAENGLTYYPELHRLGALAVSDIHGDRLKAIHEANPASYQEQGYKAALATFREDAAMRPDGLLIEDDMMVAAALSVLHMLKILPGEDIKIAVQANIGSPLLFGYESRLTMWQVDPAEIARRMFGMLDTLMNGEFPEDQIVHVGKRFSA